MTIASASSIARLDIMLESIDRTELLSTDWGIST
eukprot:CAMPEP_0184684520 /NCGR_PEP_ID=MMETSP0312-20130426/15624_1 /TAXON_ID=31354 /ORGANISM="Compsopogon coeruleus, Strain SAG 36.94" /LENGTH=33 /DNA_ID= /DNA_START= /DNA_END= /DNA_ORIENTATION=